MKKRRVEEIDYLGRIFVSSCFIRIVFFRNLQSPTIEQQETEEYKVNVVLKYIKGTSNRILGKFY